ncbi:Trk system potassium transporter TrkA [Desulfobacterales bacterium HSG17]|nr:Trk system potassium transporter TrkA [Desulfobacterales bacterium HSG17]
MRKVDENLDAQTILASGTSPKVLEKAGVSEAEIFLAVTNSDEANLIACLMADIISPKTKKIARLRNTDFESYHKNFKQYAPHIETIINPEIEAVKTIQDLIIIPGAIDTGEFEGGKIKYIGFRLGNDTAITGIPLYELPSVLGQDRLLIVAVIRNKKLIIPQGNDQLYPGDYMYIISKQGNIQKIMSLFDRKHQPAKRILIIGGGSIALRLARALEHKKNFQLKLIEKDVSRCKQLAEQLDKTIVLQGDGTDQILLQEEYIKDTDFVVTLTNDEETNILSSLLAKQLGAKKAITSISKFSYFPLLPTIGIELFVNPRLSAINTILKYIRKGKVLTVSTIKGEQAEFMEAVALETSDIVERPLKTISMPKSTLITSIIRNDEIIIPHGDSIIHTGDRIILFTRRQDIPKIEKFLTVKLEYF